MFTPSMQDRLGTEGENRGKSSFPSFTCSQQKSAWEQELTISLARQGDLCS